LTESKSIYVVGTGTIGEPLIGLFSDFRTEFGIDEVIFQKHSPKPEDVPRIQQLIAKGGRLAVESSKCAEFEKIGQKPVYTTDEAIERASVVLDCTPKGCGLENKANIYAKHASTTKGFIAQGSEFGFGKMCVHGINNEALRENEDKYIHIVSCNTHNLSVLIDTIALSNSRENLESGRFVCMRRATDVGQTGKGAQAPTVGGHGDQQFGTHHAKDAHHLYKTLGLNLNLFSSAIALNTQYMHTIWFDLKLKTPTTHDSLLSAINENPYIAVTDKDSTKLIFAFGRDYGYYGWILNNTVIPTDSIHVSDDGTEVRGFCFTPQDGNSLISSVAATLWYLDPATYESKLQALDSYLFSSI